MEEPIISINIRGQEPVTRPIIGTREEPNIIILSNEHSTETIPNEGFLYP